MQDYVIQSQKNKHMKKYLVLTLFLVGLISQMYAQKNKPERITATFIVSIHCHSCKDKITNAISQEPGIRKLNVNMKDKTVAVTFMSDKNSVSNLLDVFKRLGYMVTVQEVSCIGSKDGCLNAVHPVSTMK